MSIRTRILSGCLALTLITAALGLYSQFAQRRIGSLASQIYDETVIAISYLRSTQIAVGRIGREVARPTLPRSDPAKIDDLFADALANFDVAKSRAMSDAGRFALSRMGPRLQELAGAIKDGDRARIFRSVDGLDGLFDTAIEIYAADGFRSRQAGVTMVQETIHRTAMAIGFALVAALVITAVLARSIVPALRDAVRVAQSIAGGRLDNAIVTTGRGETANLLRALAAMQAGIAESLDHIRSLMNRQTESHAGELALQHAKLEAALDNMSQGLCMFDEDDGLVMANKRFTQMFSAPEPGSKASFMPSDTAGTPMFAVFADTLHANASVVLADGRTIATTRRSVAAGGWIATFEDVTEQRSADAKLAHMARHDPLTGLANRLHLSEHMPGALARARRSNGLAVLCLDLDRFKAVNDTLGHGAGDALLRGVCERLGQCTRETDLVARVGGDEFTIVQEAVMLPKEATALASRIVELLSQPFDIQGHQIVIGVSIGIAVSDGHAASPEALLKCADLALYRAKHEGRGTFKFFEKGMDEELQARRELEFDLRRAVQLCQLEVYYQPLLAGRQGISGFEALVRWRHPIKGLVRPALFIPLAEEIGLIGSIGGWVLQQATQDAAAWPGTLKVAVNLSPAQFKEGTLVRQVVQALATSGLDATRLELEITESVLMQEDDLALNMLHELRGLGVRIAMDDFGTGYSSLSYLRRFPFDKIKIDQSFVRSMTDNSDCNAIIKAVIALGGSLNMAVNAEGVETEDQFAALRSQGCDEMQGYLFSEPRPAGEVLGLLEQHGNATLPALAELEASCSD